MSAPVADVFAECKREFRSAAYAPDTWVSIAHTVRFFAIAAALLAGQIGLEASGLSAWVVWSLGVVLALFQGATYAGLHVIGHDCGHNAFSRVRAINRWAGHLVMAPMMVNFAHWRRSHNLHHATIANIERDEAYGPKVRQWGLLGRGVQLFLRGLMFLPFVVYSMQILLPFTDKLKSPGYANYFWPSAERESQISFAFIAAHIAVVVGVAIAVDPAFAFRALFLPVLVAWNTFLVYSFLNHTGPDTVWYPSRIWTYREGVHNSHNVSYGPVLDYFLIGITTDHYGHHLYPHIPWYHLARARAFIGDAHPNNRVLRLGFFGGCAAFVRWTWRRVRQGYVTDETRPFVYSHPNNQP